MKKQYTFHKLTLALLIIVFISLYSTCQHSGHLTKSEKISELLSLYAEYGQFNGSILVSINGQVIFKEGYGKANLEWNIPNDPDTKFRLASVSKQFTAMVIIQLVEEGKLNLEAPISTYISDYPKKNGNRITIHHLLTHTSGIPNYTSFSNYREIMSNPIKPRELVELFADSTLHFSPGERFEYSNSGYVLLGHIIEHVTGKEYKEVVKDRIFTPLGMNKSGYDNSQQIIENRASGYYKNGNSYMNANYIDMSVPFAAGGLYSTVEDLFLWDRAIENEELISKKYLKIVFERHIEIGRGQYYGYGWDLSKMPLDEQSEGTTIMSHSGVINGFNSLITRIPFNQSAIILVSNIGGAPLYSISRAVTAILFERPYELPKRSVATFLFNSLNEDGKENAIDIYEEIKDSSSFYLDENELNIIGYEYLQEGKFELAAFVFELNIKAFPKSYNVYDSYGELLLLLGEKEKAIENYKRSVTINPENQFGLEVLRELGVEMGE